MVPMVSGKAVAVDSPELKAFRVTVDDPPPSTAFGYHHDRNGCYLPFESES
jgi:hypothetical protein